MPGYYWYWENAIVNGPRTAGNVPHTVYQVMASYSRQCASYIRCFLHQVLKTYSKVNGLMHQAVDLINYVGDLSYIVQCTVYITVDKG